MLLSDWYLAYWIDLAPEERDDANRLGAYGGLVAGFIILAFIRTSIFIEWTTRASATLHESAFHGIIYAPV